MAAEEGPDTPTDTQSVPTQLTSTPYDGDSKPNVAEMFKRMGDKLGWFQFDDLETARKILTNSSKKKSTKSRIGKETQHRRGKKLLESEMSTEKISFKLSPLQEKVVQNISNEDFEEPIPPHKSKACTDLTKECKEKKKVIKKVTRISIIPSVNAENVSPVFAQHSDKRYSISNADAGNPIQESTRIHSRQSIDQLLGMSSESSQSCKDNTENDTEEDSYRQLNIQKNHKHSDSGDVGLTKAPSRIQITRSDQEDTQLYTTAQSEILETDPLYQTGMEKEVEILDGNPSNSMEASEDVQNILESSVESTKRMDSSSYIEMEDASAQVDVSDGNHKLDSKSEFQNPNGAGSKSSPNGSLLKCSDNSGLDSLCEQIVKVAHVHSQEESNVVEESDDLSSIEIGDVSLQTSVFLLSQKNSNIVTESDSSYVEVTETSIQTSFTGVLPKDNGHKSFASLCDQESNRSDSAGMNEGNSMKSEPQNSSSVREENTERAVTSNSKENNGFVHHNIFSSGEESSDDDFITSKGKVIQKTPKSTNVGVKKQDEKGSVHKVTEGGKVKAEVNTERLDLDDSLSDIIPRARHTEEPPRVGAVCETVKGPQYPDLSSDSDDDVSEENGEDWVEGVLSSDSDDFLSDRGISVKEKRKNLKTGQQQPSTGCWRTPKQYKSDSSDDEEELESFFHKIRASKNFTPKDAPKKNRSLDEFIVDDDEMSSSDNDAEFYITTNSVFSTPIRKVGPIEVFEDDDAFKSDIKLIQRKKNVRRQKTSSTNKKKIDVWDDSDKEEEEKYSFLKSLSTDAPEDLCDREALRYSKNFKKMKEELTKRLFKIYNETVFDKQLPEDLPIQWNNRLLKTAGYCVYKKNAKVHNSSSVRIELSTKVCDSAERVRDTLIHELCHAAVWILHGKNDGHGPYWRIWAKRSNLSHPEIPIIARCHSYSITTKYTYQCSKCGYSIGRHSKSLDTSRKVCGFCHGEFLLINNKQTSRIDPRSGFTPSTPRTPNKFAMYVKENYGTVKGREKGLKHGDIMKLLGKEFAEKNKISS